LNQKIQAKLDLLPELPGVYMMRDLENKIIYIGKALVLKNRIKSYFSGSLADNKTKHLVSHIEDFEYIITNSEEEAFILEATFIKQHQPHYNILLKDDKKYPFIKIASQEQFPRLSITRDIHQDGSKYFGPFTDSRHLRKLLRELEWIFPYRTCQKNISDEKLTNQRPCLNYQLHKCPGPCIGKISPPEYRSLVEKIIKFITGKNEELVIDLTKEMQELAENLEFEKAAKNRDLIQYLESTVQKQVVYFPDGEDRDIIAFYREDNHVAVTRLRMLKGKISNIEVFNFRNIEEENTENILRAFILQHYSLDREKLPFQILVQIEPEDYTSLNKLFDKKIIVPKRGEYKKLIEIARKNAFDNVENQKLRFLKKTQRTIVPIQELKEFLGLKALPRKIVAIDISTIQGAETVASLVFFENGKALKKQYRHFIIKTVEGQNDCASMAEVMNRYLKHLINDTTQIFDHLELDHEPKQVENNLWEKPDLIIVDGGKGQLHSAWDILQKFLLSNPNLASIEIASLAKRLEEVFRPNQAESIIIPRHHSSLKLITAIRDEAHNFALQHHRKRRNVRTLASKLDQIKGISESKKFILLNHFGSVENIFQASKEELLTIKGVGEKLIQAILRNRK